MITIPLAPVAAFLRRHDALAALEGAPFQQFQGTLLYALRDYEVTAANIDRFLARHPEAVLYLGSGDICPAAEGWAARVLALARGIHLPALVLLSTSARFVRLERDGILYEWRWDTEGDTDRLTSMEGATPSPSAARLAAVLAYELERTR